MSDTILDGAVTIYYLDENRQKRLKWNGAGTVTANALYSALQDWFDEVGRMDDGTVMSAQTPVEYTIGAIDAGDLDPWYISYDMMEHVIGGAIKTAGWTHVNGSAVGIVTVPVTSNNIVIDDVGQAISGATTGAGTLLDVIEGGATDYLVIRPNTNAAAHIFTTASQTITEAGTNHTATQSGAVSNTGEQIWANLYSIGTIETDTHIYVYQGVVSGASPTRARILSITSTTQDWWADGHLDRCFFIKDYKTSAFSTIDGGYLSVFARKFTTLYDTFEVSTSITSGGRNPIPLATAPDLNNTTGYKSITYTNAAGTWNVGNEILGGTSGARGIITKIVTPGATQTVHYYLIDDPQTDFQTAAETANNQDANGTGSKDANAPATQGPALQSWYSNNAFPTAIYANVASDVDDDGSTEGYGINLDCNGNTLAEVYEWIKYTFRRGGVTTGDSDGIAAEEYVGGTVYLGYSGTVTGTITEGNGVTQETSLATGIVVSHSTAKKQILLRDTRGTFYTHATLATLTDNITSGTVEIDTTGGAAVAFAPNKQAPLGAFAGGTFFGARGVLLSDWAVANENSFQLAPTSGGVKTRPVAITLTVSNLYGGAETSIVNDRVAVFRLTAAAGDIKKEEYSAAGGEAIGDATLVADSSIDKDVPGKTAPGAVLRIRDHSDNHKEYRIRYTSWTTATFTLANMASFVTTATTTTTVITYATGGFTAGVKRGDLVLNSTRANAVSYVVSVDTDTQLTISPAITGQTTGDSVEINCIPVVIDTLDDIYIPLIDKYATATTAVVSIVYDATIDYRVIVRNVAATAPNGPIVPFATDDATSGTSRSVATIRTKDNIYTV